MGIFSNYLGTLLARTLILRFILGIIKNFTMFLLFLFPYLTIVLFSMCDPKL
jgi:hypothetical protein